MTSRLTLLCSLMTLAWFLTTHILEYTSITTCRSTSPHLWWLVFGILCTIYLMLLEIVALGFIVLVLAPILFVSSRVLEIHHTILICSPDILEYPSNLRWSSPLAASQYDQPGDRQVTEIGRRPYPTRYIHTTTTRRCKICFGRNIPLLSPKTYEQFSTSFQTPERFPKKEGFHS